MGIEKYNLPHADNYIGKDYGGSKEEIEAAFAKYYVTREVEFIKDLELEKTPRDIEILTFLEQIVDEYLKRYGRTRFFDVMIEKIHLVRPGGTDEYTDGKFDKGSHSVQYGSILVDRVESDVEFALVALHELVHLKSFKVLQINEKEERVEARRAGFSLATRGGREYYFDEIDEAITELLTQRIYYEYFEKSGLFEEADLRAQAERAKGRVSERLQLFGLIIDLYEENKKDFSSIKEVEDLFIDGAVNGRLLPVARLIEKTYGKGSFRKLGEETGRAREGESDSEAESMGGSWKSRKYNQL